MDRSFQTLLLNITKELDDQNVKELTFLCGDKLTSAEKQNIHDGNSLFHCLQRKGLVSEDKLSFLKEILFKIGRNDILIRRLSMKDVEDLQNSQKHISPYRSLLYDISQDLETADVKNVKFHLYPNKAKLEKTVSMMDVLTEMEKDLLLNENKLKNLKETLKVIGRLDLCEKIQKYEEKGRQSTYLDTTQEKMPIQENPTNQPVKPAAISGKAKNFEQYNLDKHPHGWCVILNNEDFEKAGRNEQNKRNIEDREGTAKDAEEIRRVFEKRNYTVKEYKNMIGQEMIDIAKEYQNKNHSHNDSFICFILSHGQQDIVFGVDGEKVPIKDLTSCFNGKNCPSLVGKPKVFFIQACRGDELDCGVRYEEDSSTYTYESDNGSLPITADFLTAYASTEDYGSLRSTSNGSVYVQELCKILEDPSFVQEDLKDILTMVQENIAKQYYNLRNEGVKQMPSYKSELRKKLILPHPENM